MLYHDIFKDISEFVNAHIYMLHIIDSLFIIIICIYSNSNKKDTKLVHSYVL